jgi:MFS family permease
MHLYLLIALPFVAELMHASIKDPAVARTSGIIQAAFLAGWALGGGFFGRIGDLLGRSAALSLTILTYALFTGLSFFAHTWWELMIFRFVAALGIGGEWAVGASLISETWPGGWRPWLAAILQSGVNLGVLVACAVRAGLVEFGFADRCVFLVGILPALVVLWIRRQVPEPQEWHAAKLAAKGPAPGVAELFRPGICRVTVLTIVVCASSLTAWWSFMFWGAQHFRTLPDVANWTDAQRSLLTTVEFFLVIGVSIPGNFFAGWLAKRMGYRNAISGMFIGFFVAMFGAYVVPRDYFSLLFWTSAVGFFSGVFGLFTMYLPQLFPTLLRTTGAGFAYNIGRLAAAAGSVIFGLTAKVQDFRVALFCGSFLFLPAIVVALMLPDLRD